MLEVDYEAQRTMSIADAPEFTDMEWQHLNNGHRFLMVQECPENTGFYRVLLIDACGENNKEIWILKPDDEPGYSSAEHAHSIAMMYKYSLDDYVIVRPLGIDIKNPQEWTLDQQFSPINEVFDGDAFPQYHNQ